LQRYPNHATARLWHGAVLTEVGTIDEAVAARRRALQLDPLANPTNNSMGTVLMQAGRYDEAIAAYKSTLELDPGYADAHGGLGLVYLKMGRRDEGIAEMETCARLSRNSIRMVARLAHAYGLIGRQADGRRLLQALLERSRREWVSPMAVAHAYAGLGDFDQAFASLEDAYTQGTATLIRLKSDPFPRSAQARSALRRFGQAAESPLAVIVRSASRLEPRCGGAHRADNLRDERAIELIRDCSNVRDDELPVPASPIRVNGRRRESTG
jgi:tetratricopeptide (TPR) repeat protein